MWPSREQVLQEGLIPSHFNLRFRQIMQARRLGFGTLELPAACPSGEVLVPFTESDTMMVSGGVSELEDMLGELVCDCLTRQPSGRLTQERYASDQFPKAVAVATAIGLGGQTVQTLTSVPRLVQSAQHSGT